MCKFCFMSIFSLSDRPITTQWKTLTPTLRCRPITQKLFIQLPLTLNHQLRSPLSRAFPSKTHYGTNNSTFDYHCQNPPQPQVSLLDNETLALTFLAQISSLWNSAIIIKTTGKQLQTLYLRERLFGLWKLNKNPRFLHIGLNFYVVFNLLDVDRVKLLTSRWKVGYDPLLVRSWISNSNPEAERQSLISITWIKLLFLPLEYHLPVTLISIGNTLRKTVALDATKSNSLQASTARICVECDLASKLFSKVCLNGHSQEVLYENLTFFLWYHALYCWE